MIKNSVVALATAAALLGVAAPAMAAAPFGGGSSEMREFVAASYLSELQRQGVKATSVEEWGDYVRAFVTLEDGSQTMQFFVPGTLAPVTL